MNFTKEEIEEIKEALETRESFLKKIVDGADKRAAETNDTESAHKHIEMIHSIKDKLDNAHVIYLWRE
jgi:hypothetical protein